MATKSKAGSDLGPGTGIGNEGSAGGAGTPKLASKQEATGQRSSKERGSATNNKKSPGKRAKQGGSSA